MELFLPSYYISSSLKKPYFYSQEKGHYAAYKTQNKVGKKKIISSSKIIVPKELELNMLVCEENLQNNKIYKRNKLSSMHKK
jgi:hypothetical protein